MARKITYRPNYDRLTTEVYEALTGSELVSTPQEFDSWVAVRHWLLTVPVAQLETATALELAEEYDKANLVEASCLTCNNPQSGCTCE